VPATEAKFWHTSETVSTPPEYSWSVKEMIFKSARMNASSCILLLAMFQVLSTIRRLYICATGCGPQQPGLPPLWSARAEPCSLERLCN
jgi:hypothetical protein